MSLNIGPTTWMVIGVGGFGLILNIYLLTQMIPKPWLHGTTVFLLLMIMGWGIYFVVLGAALSSDNPEMGSDDYDGF